MKVFKLTLIVLSLTVAACSPQHLEEASTAIKPAFATPKPAPAPLDPPTEQTLPRIAETERSSVRRSVVEGAGSENRTAHSIPSTDSKKGPTQKTKPRPQKGKHKAPDGNTVQPQTSTAKKKVIKAAPPNQCCTVINLHSTVVYLNDGEAVKGFQIYLEQLKAAKVKAGTKYLKQLIVKFYDSNGKFTVITGGSLTSTGVFDLLFDDRGIKTKWFDALKNHTAAKVVGLDVMASKEKASFVCCK